MTPSTLVRRPRGPLTFIGHIARALESAEGGSRPPAARSRLHTCGACLDDGRVCGLPAPYVDFKLGGFVCYEHRPGVRELLPA